MGGTNINYRNTEFLVSSIRAAPSYALSLKTGLHSGPCAVAYVAGVPVQLTASDAYPRRYTLNVVQSEGLDAFRPILQHSLEFPLENVTFSFIMYKQYGVLWGNVPQAHL